MDLYFVENKHNWAQAQTTWETRRMSAMGDATIILEAIQRGERRAAEELIPLVYQELRHLAASRLAHQPPGQTLQATELVHEAYLRLVATEAQGWDGRRHFFAAVRARSSTSRGTSVQEGHFGFDIFWARDKVVVVEAHSDISANRRRLRAAGLVRLAGAEPLGVKGPRRGDDNNRSRTARPEPQGTGAKGLEANLRP